MGTTHPFLGDNSHELITSPLNQQERDRSCNSAPKDNEDADHVIQSDALRAAHSVGRGTCALASIVPPLFTKSVHLSSLTELKCKEKKG